MAKKFDMNFDFDRDFEEGFDMELDTEVDFDFEDDFDTQDMCFDQAMGNDFEEDFDLNFETELLQNFDFGFDFDEDFNMEDMDFEEDEDDEYNKLTEPQSLEEILDLIRECFPKEHMMVLNIPKYKETVQSIYKIVKFVKTDCPDAHVEVRFDMLFGTNLELYIIADELSFFNSAEFGEAVKCSASMYVIPGEDKKVCACFSYHDVRLIVPQTTNREV